jgi:hypothetical protein
MDTSTVDPDRAAIFVVEFFVWWKQAGQAFYGRDDEGLREFGRDAVKAVGGWRQARHLLRTTDQTTRILIEAKGLL